jgi:hypothetical protein
MGVKPFAAGNTLESLRDSDFDSCSAYGEVIDNSIQAKCTEVKIRFEQRGQHEIERVIFMDDGQGMSVETLQNCLRLGWSARYDDRSGIGRFGVGMTLGGIHECRRIEVYSKERGGRWNYTYLDLDEIKEADENGKDWEIPAPTARQPNTIPEEYVPADHGTIVIWSKYDRPSDKFATLMKEFKIWLGRTYRYFIWNEKVNREKPLRIFLNGNEIPAIDPLYVRTEKTEFPEDEAAFEYTPIDWDWPIGEKQIEEKFGTETAKIHVRLSLLPKSLRPQRGAGGGEEAKIRHIPMNEGFSILRGGREVGYDWIPRLGLNADEKDRWWGCEIHFDPVLDRAFTTKIIKRGANPVPDLRKHIYEKLSPWIRKQRETVSRDWKETEIDSASNPLAQPSIHHLSEVIAKKTATQKSLIAIDKDPAKSAEDLAKQLAQGNEEKRTHLESQFKNQPYTVVETTWPGGTFIDIQHMGGSDALLYNQMHVFFVALSNIRKNIESSSEISEDARRLTTLIDLVLISYAKAESLFRPDDHLSATHFIDTLKSNWGNLLKNYIENWSTQHDADILNEK